MRVISRKQSHLTARVPEQNRLAFREVLLPDVREETGHRFACIDGIQEDRLGPRRELNRLL